jgi:hypothetical protein
MGVSTCDRNVDVSIRRAALETDFYLTLGGLHYVVILMLPLAALHAKHAVQPEIWVPKKPLL